MEISIVQNQDAQENFGQLMVDDVISNMHLKVLHMLGWPVNMVVANHTPSILPILSIYMKEHAKEIQTGKSTYSYQAKE